MHMIDIQANETPCIAFKFILKVGCGCSPLMWKGIDAMKFIEFIFEEEMQNIIITQKSDKNILACIIFYDLKIYI